MATLWPLVHGCETVHGGAVELSWKLRPASGTLLDKFVDCDSGLNDTNPVTQVRLNWQVGAGDAARTDSQSWPCAFNHGVTGFDLPEGTADLWLTLGCGDNPVVPASPDTYIAPAVLQRDVVRGATVSLGAVELVVSVSNCKTSVSDTAHQACICCFDPAVCTHR